MGGMYSLTRQNIHTTRRIPLTKTWNVFVQVHIDDPAFFDTFYTNTKLDKHQWFYRLFGDNLAAVSTPSWVSTSFSRSPKRFLEAK